MCTRNHPGSRARGRDRTGYTGFTLIELLVVIAIIAILAAILFPVFARARENARRASCMSNLKQIGLGVMQYTQDYDEKYPMAWYGRISDGTPGSFIQTQPGTPGATFTVCDPSTCGGSGAGHFFTWMDFIFPYVKSVQLFSCPSSSDPPYLGGPVPDYHMNGAYSNAAILSLSSPSASNFMAASYGMPIVGAGTSMSAVQRPADSIMIYEMSGPGLALYNMRGAPTFVASYGADPTYGKEFKPHLEGANITYGDGHVKWKALTSILSELGPANSGTCNLSAIDESYNFCAKSWNPFRP